MNVSASRASPISDRHPMPCEHDDGPAFRAAIGLVTLCNDVTIDKPELRNFLPRDGSVVGVEAACLRMESVRKGG